MAFYGARFGRPLAGPRKALLYLAVAVSVVSGFSRWFRDAMFYVAPVVDLGRGVYYWLFTAMVVLPILFGLLAIADAIRYASQMERRRLAWVVAAFVPWFIGVTLGSALSGWWLTVQNVSFFLIPAALTYAALSRRLFDVGFVLNRAAVFAGVSAIVVGAFVLLEWALGQWFEGLSHASSLAINAGLALVLGVSFRVIHQYVDRAVDTIFFRKRHANETALRRFAREAAFFTSEEALVERTRNNILDHSDVSSVQVLCANELDSNDAAVVAMKAWQEPVDLSNCTTSIEGEVAFPMLAHGALIGAIVCGAKTTGEHFAPDEIETLQTLAHGVGLALEGLHRNAPGDAASSRIERRLDAVADAIAQLPTAIAHELRATPVE